MTAPLISPFAVGVKLTLSVHLANEFRVAGLAPHGVVPPATTPKLPLAEEEKVCAVLALFVMVML